jgi:hypothetical protein
MRHSTIIKDTKVRLCSRLPLALSTSFGFIDTFDIIMYSTSKIDEQSWLWQLYRSRTAPRSLTYQTRLIILTTINHPYYKHSSEKTILKKTRTPLDGLIRRPGWHIPIFYVVPGDYTPFFLKIKKTVSSFE